MYTQKNFKKIKVEYLALGDSAVITVENLYGGTDRLSTSAVKDFKYGCGQGIQITTQHTIYCASEYDIVPGAVID